jgi:ribosomal protein S18 acetylase RimI-like enzyme
MRIKHLDWDSTFFRKNIGLLELSNDGNFPENQNDFDLIYVVSDQDIAIEIIDYKQSYSENKIIFSKKIVQNKEFADANIFTELQDSNKKEIYDLAFESGKFSRFKLDPNFGQSGFEALYKIWVDNSLNKKIADAVIVYKEQGNILGFVTYKVCGTYATIGLIGVCLAYQGKGIGKKLIASVENELVTNGIEELRIPTQLQNEMACKFYKGLGYTIIENKSIRHFWRNYNF